MASCFKEKSFLTPFPSPLVRLFRGGSHCVLQPTDRFRKQLEIGWIEQQLQRPARFSSEIFLAKINLWNLIQSLQESLSNCSILSPWHGLPFDKSEGYLPMRFNDKCTCADPIGTKGWSKAGTRISTEANITKVGYRRFIDRT